MLGDAVAAALPEMQAHAESMMRDECTVRRVTGVSPDPLTGEDRPEYGPVLYEGKCRLKGPSSRRQSPAVGDDSTVVLSTFELHLPVSAEPDGEQVFASGDVAECRGRTFRLVDGHDATFQTAIRLPCEVW